MTKVFVGGMPYGPDVRRMLEAFPVADLKEGRIILHQDIAGVLNYEPKTSRYYGIVNSWINRIRNEFGVIIRWEPSMGLKVLPPDEVLLHAENKTRQKFKQTGRAVKLFGWVDRARLDDVGRNRLDHQLKVADAIRRSLEGARRELAVELGPAKSLPKPQIVPKAS